MQNVEQRSSTSTVPNREGCRPPGLVLSSLLGFALLLLLAWQFAGVAVGGQQVINPELGLYWKVAILAAVSVSTACGALAWLGRQWTRQLAVANALGNAVGAGAVIWLTLAGMFFAEAVPAAIGDFLASTDPMAAQNTADVGGVAELFVLVVLGVAIWDSLDGILRVRRSGPSV
ncbi:hypothetical protein ACQCX2_02950 [Propionibacteriaceae bacterium Y1700]|uniref:hypothetical protein n=1 Tax=Microlunatus sp. Y1700 TaxID=3418487 RepID=UPI003DA7928C